MNGEFEIFRDKDVLITGGLGFIGSTVARRLVGYGANVTLLDSLIPDYGGNLFNIKGIEDEVKVNIADLRDRYGINYLVQGRDYIFNLAGTLSHVDSLKDPFTDLEINCVSQLSLLEACRKHNSGVKVIFAGTRGQYGRPEYLPVDEKHPMHPTEVNGVHNLAAEWYHILYYRLYGIRTTSLRLTNTYGPRHQMKHHRQGVVNWFVRLVLEDKEVALYGDGKQVRDTNYVDDVVDALLLAGCSEQANGEVYNLGGMPASLEDIVKLLIKITNRGRYRCVPYPADSRAIEIGDYVADCSKMRKALGWEARVSVEEGLRRTVEYYGKHASHYW